MTNDEIQPKGDVAVAIVLLDNETSPFQSGASGLGGRCPFNETSGSIDSEAAVPPGVAKTGSAFVALSKFVIANDKAAEVKAAFRNRPHKVDKQPGFERMEVLSPLDRPDKIWLLRFWSDEQSFHVWHHSHLYHDSHKGIPRGLKLVPGETQIRRFDHVAS